MLKFTKLIFVAVLCLFLAVTLSCDRKKPHNPPEQDVPKMDPYKEPVSGMKDFVSADPNGDSAYSGPLRNGLAVDAAQAPAADPSAASEDADQSKTVEEGDIYRVLGNQIIANLNRYRGLQLIDVSDPSAPAIVGNLRISASPVEMYAKGEYAYLLMNNWQGYSGKRDDIKVERYNGGVILAIDISDPSAPEIVDRLDVPGYIRTSRMVTDGSSAALYIASNQYNEGSQTIVQSFTLDANGGITAKSKIDLGGNVQDIQATPEAMLVARIDWQNRTDTNSLAIIDISNTDGTMVEGADISIAGRIAHKSNMDLYNGVLRVVSGSHWDNNMNHLETFNVADINNPIAVDHDEFGEGEGLEATLFLGNKAFFVTYFRQDPFHAFEIDDEGNAEEKLEYIISGWNDFFRAVSDETRLIGIGKNDENGNNMAVSLYDISDLSNLNPFISRAEVAMDSSWSEANWDDRAFSVLENAVSVYAKDVEETGLVLLPFHGYKRDVGSMSGVQIFTFSDQTLTKRGVMEQNDQVRRSFLAQSDAVANISEAELSLFDHTDPDAPVELSRLGLAPNYSDFMIFGNYGARLKGNAGYGYYDRPDTPNIPVNTLEVIALNQDPEKAAPVATLEIPANASIYQVTNLLVTVEMTWQEEKSETHIQVYDFSDPEDPRKAGSLTTDKLQPSNNRWFVDDMPMIDARMIGPMPPMYYSGGAVFEMDDSLVFTGVRWENELIGEETVCRSYVENQMGTSVGVPVPVGVDMDMDVATDPVMGAPPPSIDSAETSGGAAGEDEEGMPEPVDPDQKPIDVEPVEKPIEDELIEEPIIIRVENNEWYNGGIVCRNLKGEEPVCTGEIRHCVRDEDYCTACEVIDPSTVKMTTRCSTQERYNNWQITTVSVLDLTDPDNPRLADQIEMPKEEQQVGMMADGDTLYYSYKVPYTVEGESKTYSRHYFKAIDISNPARPAVADGVNIPGTLLKVDGDSVYTHDFFWKDNVIESSLNRLVVEDGEAELVGRHAFSGQNVMNMLLDDQGHALVSHREAYVYVEQTCPPTERPYVDPANYLSVLDTTAEDMPAVGKFEVDSWADMRDTKAGRILFSIPGGLLIVNIEDAAKPFAQAFFATQGWPNEFVLHDMNVTFAAGMYGIYRFELDEYNLD